MPLCLIFHLHPANKCRARSVSLWPIWALSSVPTRPSQGLSWKYHNTAPKFTHELLSPPLPPGGSLFSEICPPSWANSTVLGQTIKNIWSSKTGEKNMILLHIARIFQVLFCIFLLVIKRAKTSSRGRQGVLLISVFLDLSKRKLLPSSYFSLKSV